MIDGGRIALGLVFVAIAIMSAICAGWMWDRNRSTAHLCAFGVFAGWLVAMLLIFGVL